MNHYFHPDPESDLTLTQEESMHIVKVLRCKIGDQFAILDGAGNKYIAAVADPHPKACTFKILTKESAEPKSYRIHIAIAPTKSTDRLEWFVEKACELGADEISIIMTQRTERKKVNIERLEKKALAAMKQSKNRWRCKLHPVVNLNEFAKMDHPVDDKFVAYVETNQEDLLQRQLKAHQNILVLIGPEGDFVDDEVALLKSNGFKLASLGSSVLRTETAGVVATHTICLVNQTI